MNYDVVLTDVGDQRLSVAFAIMNTIQQLSPMPITHIHRARSWVNHTPILLRRSIAEGEALSLQHRYEQLGASVMLIPSQFFFPEDIAGLSRWRNEWFSSHLMALGERKLTDWAQDHRIQEAYRFSYMPSYGIDLTVRFWADSGTGYGSACRSIGSIGPLPGPPDHEAQWVLNPDEWEIVRESFQNHHFWESESWNTVPDGYVVLDSAHWILEGWREKRYHALFDLTPDDGAAREVGITLLELLPDTFKKVQVE